MLSLIYFIDRSFGEYLWKNHEKYFRSFCWSASAIWVNRLPNCIMTNIRKQTKTKPIVVMMNRAEFLFQLNVWFRYANWFIEIGKIFMHQINIQLCIIKHFWLVKLPLLNSSIRLVALFCFDQYCFDIKHINIFGQTKLISLAFSQRWINKTCSKTLNGQNMFMKWH